jgi:hypothetical protein
VAAAAALPLLAAAAVGNGANAVHSLQQKLAAGAYEIDQAEKP